jgi:hypothetical protein
MARLVAIVLLAAGCARTEKAPQAPAAEPQPEVERDEEEDLFGAIGLIEDAKAAMVAQQPKEALALLREHERAYPKSNRGERERLEIAAKCGLGMEDELLPRMAESGRNAAEYCTQLPGPPPRHPQCVSMPIPWDWIRQVGAEDCGKRLEAEYRRHWDPDKVPPRSRAKPDVAPKQARFRARVGKVVMLSRFMGTIIPVHPDPRFVLPLVIETAPANDAVLVKGATVHFAIHSPSKLFAGDPPTGRTREFIVESRVTDGVRRWSGLRVAR